jgi:hypothetical protein
MFNGMTTNENYNEVALFLHQMIPHHHQAVNQAKSLFLNGDFSCPKEDLGSDEYDCVLTNLVLSIMNAQNAQVQTFRMLLESYEFPEFDSCDLKKSGGESSEQTSPYDFEDISRYSGWGGDGYSGIGGRRLEEEMAKKVDEEITKRDARGLGESRKTTHLIFLVPFERAQMNVNITIPPPPSQKQVDEDGICRGHCSTTKYGKEVCVFTTKLAIHESDVGAWYFEECGEDNLYPTIGVEIGQSAVFVQEDITNWYHPLGFAYFVDGAHVGKEEVEAQYLTYRVDAQDIGLDGYEPLFLHSPSKFPAAECVVPRV